MNVLANQAVAQSGTIRDALRVQTNDVHQQLHRHGSFVALFDGSIDMPHYTALMQRFHGYYAAMDDAVSAAFDLPQTNFTYAKRGDLLAQDLADLGVSDADIAANPRCDALFDIVSPASLGGVLYVIEGAALGAAQIDRAAQKILSPTTTQGRAFWCWSRAQGKARWAAMTQMLQDLQASEQLHAPMIQGANDTFQALADWLAPLDQTAAPKESIHL